MKSVPKCKHEFRQRRKHDVTNLSVKQTGKRRCYCNIFQRCINFVVFAGSIGNVKAKKIVVSTTINYVIVYSFIPNRIALLLVSESQLLYK